MNAFPSSFLGPRAQSHAQKSLAALVSVAALFACSSDSSSSNVTPTCGTVASSETVRVMNGLAPSCAGCHQSGNRGYFASIGAFQSLLVADAKLIVPGHPEQSELVRLLEGSSSNAFPQMPPAGDSYAKLAASGIAKLPVADVRAWISALPTQERTTAPDPTAPHISRMSAQVVQRALYAQLGLVHEDFFISADEYSVPMAESRGDDNYPMQGSDSLPAPRQAAPADRHLALGGASAIQQTRGDTLPSANFANAFVQISQAWCRKGIAKENNPALFPTGSAKASDAPAVKATLERWWLHFLAEKPKPGEVDALYTNVFVPLAAKGDVEPGYVGTCSYFLRHPHWVFY